MAAERETAEARLLDCGMCLEPFTGDEDRPENHPHILSACGHSICHECGEALSRHAAENEADNVLCPFCRTPNRPPFPKNFQFIDHLELFSRLVPPSTGPDCEGVQHEGGERPPADVYCPQCASCLCIECSNQVHAIIGHADRVGALDARTDPIPSCTRDQRPLLFYCLEPGCDNALVCDTCLSRVGDHPDHAYERTADAEERNKDSIRSRLATLAMRVAAAESGSRDTLTVSSELHGNEKNQAGTLAEARAAIEEEFEVLEAALRRRREDVLLNLDNIGAELDTAVEAHTGRLGQFLSQAFAARLAGEHALELSGPSFVALFSEASSTVSEAIASTFWFAPPITSIIDIDFADLVSPLTNHGRIVSRPAFSFDRACPGLEVSDDALEYTGSAQYQSVLVSQSFTTGHWRWEFEVLSFANGAQYGNSGYDSFGITADVDSDLNVNINGNRPRTQGWYYNCFYGNLVGNSNVSGYLTTVARRGAIVLNLDEDAISFYVDDVCVGTYWIPHDTYTPIFQAGPGSRLRLMGLEDLGSIPFGFSEVRKSVHVTVTEERSRFQVVRNAHHSALGTQSFESGRWQWEFTFEAFHSNQTNDGGNGYSVVGVTSDSSQTFDSQIFSSRANTLGWYYSSVNSHSLTAATQLQGWLEVGQRGAILLDLEANSVHFLVEGTEVGSVTIPAGRRYWPIFSGRNGTTIRLHGLQEL